MKKLPHLGLACSLAACLAAPAVSHALPAVQRTAIAADAVALPAVQGPWLLMLVAQLRAGFGG